MAKDAEYGRSLRAAKRRWEEEHDRNLTNKEFGEMVGDVLGREPFQSQTVGLWFNEGQEPESFAVLRAIATVLGVETGELLSSAQQARTAELIARNRFDVLATPEVQTPSQKRAKARKRKGA